MQTLHHEDTKAIAGGAVFGPASINGKDSFIVMLKESETFYYYHFNSGTGYHFDDRGKVVSTQGPVPAGDYRTFMNQSGYRSYFLSSDFFD